MPTTTSPLTPATHGLRVAASFNLRFERLSTPMRYDRRGESGGGEGVPFLVQRVHDSRRYNSTLSVVQVATLLPKKILILCPNREIE